MLLVPLTAIANDESIMFELGFGIGNSASRNDGNDNARWCKNRNIGDELIFLAVRYRNDNREVHVARWFHEEDLASCDRDSWAVGAGYVMSTEGNTIDGVADGFHASWTPGLAYTWGKNKDFTGQDAINTNWRNTGNWQVFNRVAIGLAGPDSGVEYAINRYGTFNEEHGESFLAYAIAFKDLDSGSANNNDRGLEQPDPTIINEGDTININQTINQFEGDLVITNDEVATETLQ